MLKTIYAGRILLTCRVGQGSVIKYMYLKPNTGTSMVDNHMLLLFKIAMHPSNRLSSKAMLCRNGLFSTQDAMLTLMLSINTAIPARIIVLISLLHATLNNSLRPREYINAPNIVSTRPHSQNKRIQQATNTQKKHHPHARAATGQAQPSGCKSGSGSRSHKIFFAEPTPNPESFHALPRIRCALHDTSEDARACLLIASPGVRAIRWTREGQLSHKGICFPLPPAKPAWLGRYLPARVHDWSLDGGK